MANRKDLLAEIDTTFDGSGAYTGDWFDSAGVLAVRIIRAGGSTSTWEESSDQTHVVNSGSVVVGGNLPLTARYFRLTATGTPSAVYRAVIRAVE